MQGKLDSWQLPSNVEDLAEISSSMKIDGKPQKGFATISDSDKKAILYTFRDVTTYTEGTSR